MSLEHVQRHAKVQLNGGHAAIKALHVPCYSLPSILLRHGVEDSAAWIVTVDAEGYDLEILEGANWGGFGTGFLPRLVSFEQSHIVHYGVNGSMRIFRFVSDLQTRHGYRCEATPVSKLTSGSRSSVPTDVYCVHRAAAALPGCSDMSTCCHQEWQHAFVTPSVRGFEKVASSGACCKWSDGPEAKAFWRASPPGTQNLSSCAHLCRADSGCQHFSHSRGFGSCMLCSQCALSSAATANSKSNSHKYLSWRRVSNGTAARRSDEDSPR